MADNTVTQQQPPPTSAEADDSEPTVTFKVKTSSDTTHTITLPLSATVSELKTQLSSPDLENIPIDRQRLIYSGRVLKNDDTLGSYRIKDGNTVHMVKSAASNVQNQNQSGSGSGSGVGGGARVAAGPSAGAGADATGTATRTGAAAQGVPSNMAAGTANDLLAGLTGARFVGMGLPGREMFGPDGLGSPTSEEDMYRMLEDPSYQQMMNAALDDPRLVDLIIQSSPILRDIPNARDFLRSPMMRNMFTNPDLVRGFSSLRRNMTGGGEAFPAPGATSTTPSDAPASSEPANNATGATGDTGGAGSNPLAGFPLFQGAGAQGTDGNPSNPFASLFGGAGAGVGAEAGAGAGPGAGADNPFAALFAPPNQGQAPRFPPLDPALMTQMLQALGGVNGQGAPGNSAGAGAGGSSDDFLASLVGNVGGSQQQDNRPPEERYETQLRQLNDMGFTDFDRNVTALRRSGGSVQGAVEYLLSSP